jgi:hypothetical protein
VALERYFSFFDEYFGGVGFFFADSLALEICVCLGEAETEYDDQDGWAGAEPEQWSPAVADGVDECAREDSGKQVSECVALLEHTGYETASEGRAVFECYMRDYG